MHSYADLGVKAYVEMQKFMQEFPDLGIAACECLLTQNAGGANNINKIQEHGTARKKQFQSGCLRIVDLGFAYEAASKIVKIKSIYDGYNRTTFVRAISILLPKTEFDIDYFIEKMDRYSSMFTHRQSVGEYIALIEDVYNYRKREKQNLRY